MIKKFVEKIGKNVQFLKSCLGVKPPYGKSRFRHRVKFWKMGVLMGGWTLVPRYKKQGEFHQGLPSKEGQSFLIRRKS